MILAREQLFQFILGLHFSSPAVILQSWIWWHTGVLFPLFLRPSCECIFLHVMDRMALWETTLHWLKLMPIPFSCGPNSHTILVTQSLEVFSMVEENHTEILTKTVARKIKH
jgi:hypothetical protein